MRPCFFRAKVKTICFNPRICKRCDTKIRIIFLIPNSFNPRICKRCDCKPALNSMLMLVSIHASVKDATSILLTLAYIVTSFNPRICKRCDIAPFAKNAFTNVSIHASVKDATQYRLHALCFLVVSIHASVKDATRTWQLSLSVSRFNPRICKRCDNKRRR